MTHIKLKFFIPVLLFHARLELAEVLNAKCRIPGSVHTQPLEPWKAKSKAHSKLIGTTNRCCLHRNDHRVAGLYPDVRSLILKIATTKLYEFRRGVF